MTTTATRTIRIIVDSSDSQRQINQVNNQLEQTTRSANAASFSLNKLAAAIGGIVATQQLKDLSDAWILIQNQLGRTSESTSALAATTATLLQVSNETRQGLQNTVDLYGSLRMSTEKLGYSQEQAISMTKTINQLLLVGGKTAAQTAGAMTQLAQGLQAGALRGDEFNSVAEGAPDIMRALQKELNITQGELREFAATGGITADILAKAITNYSDEAAKAAAKTTATFAQNSEVAKNNAIAWVGASDLILGANKVAGESLVFLSQNISKLVDIAGVAAGIYVARLVPAIIAGTTAMGANIAATYASTLETIRYNTALANLAVNATIAQRATLGLTNAAVAARGALTVLFGPVGLILAGVAALAYLATGSEEATDRIKDLTDATEGLSRAQLALKQQDLEDELRKENNALTEKIEKTKELSRLNQTVESSGAGGAPVVKVVQDVEKVREREAAMARLNIEIDVQREKSEKLAESLKKVNAELNKDDAQRFADTLKFSAPAFEEPEKLVFGDSGKDAKAEQDRKDAQAKEDRARAAKHAADEIRGAKELTASLGLELETRTQVASFYRQAQLAEGQSIYEQERALLQAQSLEKVALINQRESEDTQRRNEQHRQALDEKNLNETEIAAIDAAYKAQQIAADKVYQEEKNSIEEAAAQKRIAIAKAEKEAKIQLGFDLASSGLAVLQAFGSQSEKSQKRMARVGIAVDTARGVAAGVRLGFPAGIPAIAWAIANGKKALNSLNSAGSGSIGGGAGGGASVSDSSAVPTSASEPSVPQFQQKRVVEIRGAIDGNSLVKISDLPAIMGDDSMVVLINGAQADAQRRGVI